MTTPQAEAYILYFKKFLYHVYIGIPFVKDIRPPDKYSTQN